MPENGLNILLVEDEDVVRDVTEQGLKRLGYHVITAKDAAAAQSIYAQCSKRIDLLLTDVIMPVMNGARLARALTAERPDLPVLFMSGYTDDALMKCGFSDESMNLISKPFTFDQLNKRVREALDRRVGRDVVD